MIGADRSGSNQIYQRLLSLSGSFSDDPQIDGLCRGLLETVQSPRIPGALIPIVAEDSRVTVCAAAATAIEWRQLSPLLRAFVGPTVSSFDGFPSPLSLSGGVATYLSGLGLSHLVQVDFPGSRAKTVTGLKACSRLAETLERAPALTKNTPQPVSSMLARFQDYLNIGARSDAEEILSQLRTGLRLDSLNLRFLELQLLDAFSDWSAIAAFSDLDSLFFARKPPAISAILLEALYRTHLESAVTAGDSEAVTGIYQGIVQPLALPMLHLPLPLALRVGGQVIVALEGLNSPRRELLSFVIADQLPDWLAEIVRESVQSETKAPVQEKSQGAVERAQAALMEADGSPSLHTLNDVLAAFGRLSPDEIQTLLSTEPFRSAVLKLPEATGPSDVGRPLPTDWMEWLDRASEIEFDTALDVARQGMDEWPTDVALNDPLKVERLEAALNRAQDNELAARRFSEAIPYVVGWLQRDASFPRPLATPIYSVLLTLLALGSSRGGSVFESSQLLISALVSVGLGPDAYRNMVADVEEIAGAGFGVEMVYWLLEVIEDLFQFTTPVVAAREAFLQSAIVKLAPVFGRLSSVQRQAVRQLASDVGWELSDPRIESSDVPADDFASRLAGKRIALYSLSESANRQAEAALLTLSPTASVSSSSETGGTARLKALAENADIFVISWQCAKHAATDFIRSNRGSLPLVYAQGRGFSSILRAVEDYLRTA